MTLARHAAALGVGLAAALLYTATHHAVALLLLSLLGCLALCAVLGAALWHLAASNERYDALLAASVATGDRLSALASSQVNGESAEWLNSLLGSYLWPRLLIPLLERDVQTDVARRLESLIAQRNEPDAASVPDWIEALEVDTFSFGATAPVITAVRTVPPREAARAAGLDADASPADGARTLDVDVTFSSEQVDVVLRAFVGGGVVQAIDWVGNVAGALQPGRSSASAADASGGGGGPPSSTTLAVRIRRLDFSARLRVALRTRADIALLGMLPSPPPRCRIALDVRFSSRAGASVALPLSRVPGMAGFLEAALLREIHSAIRWPHAVPRDLRPVLEVALLPPGAGPSRHMLPTLELRVSLVHVAVAADAARPEGAGGAPPRAGATLQCHVATDGGKRRELGVELAGAPQPAGGAPGSPQRAEVMAVTVVPPVSAADVGETVTFILRRPVDTSRRLGAVRDVAEGLAKVIGDRARAAAAAAAGEAAAAAPQAVLESPTLGIGKLRVLHLSCGTALVLTPCGDAPRLLALTPRGGADEATRSRGLDDVSPAPNAAVLDVELLPPGAATGGAAALVAATLRVRVEARWKEA